MSVAKENIAAAKGRGFLLNRGTDCFSGRVVAAGGLYTASQLKTIAACAEQCGSGQVAFTSRQCAEITGIPFDRLDEASAMLAEAGLSFGGTGPKVRPVTACKGTTCVYGNIDTQGLAKVLHERFYLGMRGVKLPHKFKIGVGGCPNSCMKPGLNDVGIEGRRVVKLDAGVCRGCASCAVEARCPSKAVSRGEDGKARIDAGKCLSCGVCVGKCPFGAIPENVTAQCRVTVGGTWGKTMRVGTPLSRMIPIEDVPDMVEKVLLWYRENGFEKERLGMTIDRVGMEAFEKAVFSNDLIERREEILAAPLKTGK